VVQESLAIPGTGSHLVYHSSRSAGYLSTIQLQLTPDTIPRSLNKIHLKITIEGILFEKVFEADPGIKYTYAWNRFNIYRSVTQRTFVSWNTFDSSEFDLNRQRVYGVTTALVKVGYEYNTCPEVIWEVQTTKLSGHDMSISDIGGWNLDIHHRYNFHEGILQKGDGNNIYLRYRPEVLRTIMGDGHQRPLDCTNCEGAAIKQRVLAPVALTASPDGSLYLGDYNLIRHIGRDLSVRTLLRLKYVAAVYGPIFSAVVNRLRLLSVAARLASRIATTWP
jgi:teneurin